jgi:MPBQ/MSBQ methyltransferase
MLNMGESEVASFAFEREVASDYGLTDLHKTILNNLTASGLDPERLKHDDLALIDEFHMGGRPATEYILDKMNLTGAEHVLDVGSGLGGPARCLAARYGCRVTGLDLTPEYVTIASDLTARTGLEGSVAYVVGSALASPFPDAQFDAAINFHVAMNIRERDRLYKEIARVLKPGALFCLYDVMRGANRGLYFPLHWAKAPETSHVISPSETATLLEAAGFVVEYMEQRKAFALAFLHERLDALDDDALLGFHVLLGANARKKIENMIRNLEEGRAAPIIMIARRA